ncbi:methyltransferase, FxLD system [Streptomyces sp. RGM 3693]|uniref:methyltransferase, FxLD system n=1 Tax=Streptomyces sp. RGM 3693 TaxID=3413284 RepID=UPI003D2A467E
MTVDTEQATTLRNTVMDQLRADGVLVTPEVEAAMRKVPRHAFAPEAPLEKAYEPYAAVVTKTDEYGVQISSVSAPQIQAMMLEQAQLRSGMRVLEVGSGGLNAAYMVELVGDAGEVTSVDIDPEVTERARRLLDEQGYKSVRVDTADAAEPIPGLGEVDVIMVTAGAWDIPSAWLDQLAPEGRLVVPLRMRGLTRSVAFIRRDGHLESESAKICGFVPMQGAAAHEVTLLLVAGSPEIGLRFDDGVPIEPSQLDNAITTPRVEAWTGVTIGRGELMDTLQMHLAIGLPGFCIMALDKELDSGVVTPTNPGFSLATVDKDSFAYVVYRRTEDGEASEFGVHALGTHAQQLADEVAEQLRTWESSRRGGPSPVIRVYPAGTSDDQVRGDRVIDKVHCRISLSWPTQ